MAVLSNLSEEIKNAMREKDSLKLESLRAIKSALILAQTASGADDNLNEEASIKLLQRLVKQRKESALIYKEQGRNDLADPEEAQAKIIASFLPEQLSEEEVIKIVLEVISQTGAEGIKDMGKVMGITSKKLAGKAEGKLIADIVKKKLSSEK
ncbi:MAG: GatB/YqeY domain-containing protein [Flavobacteriaceae bacterium]|tara:strand:- start:16 stop:474 length:459 start_codon:yes stop_codon:yes gene_type:complete